MIEKAPIFKLLISTKDEDFIVTRDTFNANQKGSENVRTKITYPVP